MGNEHPNLAPYGSFSCADGELVVGAGSDRQFRALADVVGLPDDPRFATNAARIENRAALNDLIAPALADEPRTLWGARFDAAGVPWAPVNDVAEAFGEAHVETIGLVAETEGVALVRTPFVLDGIRPDVRAAPPTLGQHTDEILEQLGYDPGQLRAEGVV
jgi:crotonobetainyl-CoA:carnitine CoA-transferase CaiB-like acyl-CoA transferase